MFMQSSCGWQLVRWFVPPATPRSARKTTLQYEVYKGPETAHTHSLTVQTAGPVDHREPDESKLRSTSPAPAAKTAGR